MQCSCGGQTEERQEVKKKEVVTKYVRCEACGRVHAYWRKDAVDDNRAFMKMKGEREKSDDATAHR
jgi:uncharacterized Zn finger protein